MNLYCVSTFSFLPLFAAINDIQEEIGRVVMLLTVEACRETVINNAHTSISPEL